MRKAKHLESALSRAVAHLRRRPEVDFLCDINSIFTTSDLAMVIEGGASDVLKAVSELLFAPTSAWDDAGGDPDLGNEAFELLDRVHMQSCSSNLLIAVSGK